MKVLSLKNQLDQINRQSGYTLVEMMVVVTVFTLMTAIVLISFRPLSEAKTADNFIEQVQDDLYYAQSLAVSRRETVRFQFHPDDYYYRIKSGSVLEDDYVKLKRHYSEAIKVTKGSGSLGLEVSFNRNGNVGQAGTILFDTKKGKYKLVFNVGEGRFYVEKL